MHTHASERAKPSPTPTTTLRVPRCFCLLLTRVVCVHLCVCQARWFLLSPVDWVAGCPTLSRLLAPSHALMLVDQPLQSTDKTNSGPGVCVVSVPLRPQPLKHRLLLADWKNSSSSCWRLRTSCLDHPPAAVARLWCWCGRASQRRHQASHRHQQSPALLVRRPTTTCGAVAHFDLQQLPQTSRESRRGLSLIHI